MLVNSRWRLWGACFCLPIVAVISPPAQVRAVSITGIMVYSTDDFGNPNGYESIANGQFQAQMWRTLSRPGMVWHGLGVSSGLPPRSIDSPFLNFPDFSVDLPLDEGENYFTLFAEPGLLTATDEYQRFMVTVYFDGNMEAPGISVLFPRYALPDGSAVAEARPNDDQRWGFLVQPISAAPRTYYDDGLFRVSVLRASLLPPERANMSVDRLTANTLTPGGVDGDWIGTLVLSVEPSESFGPGGGVPAPLPNSRGVGGGRGVVGGGSVPGGGGNAGYIPPGAVGQQGTGQQDYDTYGGSGAGEAAPGDFWHQGDAAEKGETEDDSAADGTPTPADLVGALEQWLKSSGDATPSPGADDAEDAEGNGTPAPTGSPGSTLTPRATTPTTPASTPTADAPAARTPTPAVTASLAATEESAGK